MGWFDENTELSVHSAETLDDVYSDIGSRFAKAYSEDCRPGTWARIAYLEVVDKDILKEMPDVPEAVIEELSGSSFSLMFGVSNTDLEAGVDAIFQQIGDPDVALVSCCFAVWESSEGTKCNIWEPIPHRVEYKMMQATVSRDCTVAQLRSFERHGPEITSAIELGRGHKLFNPLIQALNIHCFGRLDVSGYPSSGAGLSGFLQEFETVFESHRDRPHVFYSVYDDKPSVNPKGFARVASDTGDRDFFASRMFGMRDASISAAAIRFEGYSYSQERLRESSVGELRAVGRPSDFEDSVEFVCVQVCDPTGDEVISTALWGCDWDLENGDYQMSGNFPEWLTHYVTRESHLIEFETPDVEAFWGFCRKFLEELGEAPAGDLFGSGMLFERMSIVAGLWLHLEGAAEMVECVEALSGGSANGLSKEEATALLESYRPTLSNYLDFWRVLQGVSSPRSGQVVPFSCNDSLSHFRLGAVGLLHLSANFLASDRQELREHFFDAAQLFDTAEGANPKERAKNFLREHGGVLRNEVGAAEPPVELLCEHQTATGAHSYVFLHVGALGARISSGEEVSASDLGLGELLGKIPLKDAAKVYRAFEDGLLDFYFEERCDQCGLDVPRHVCICGIRDSLESLLG